MIARWKAWQARRRAIRAMVDEVCRPLSEMSPLHVGDQIDVIIKRETAVVMVLYGLDKQGIQAELGNVRSEVKHWARRERRRLRRAR